MGRKVQDFLKDISLKVDVVSWLEFELTYFDVAVQHINYNTTGFVWFGFMAHQAL